MSRFPGAECGAEEIPDDVHQLADRIENITGKDVYFIDARRHRMAPPPGRPAGPPPPISGPPAGEDIVVFVNPEAMDPQQLSNGLRRFLVQALLIWEGYPMSAVRNGTPDATVQTVGPLQQFLHMELLGLATESRLATLGNVAVPPRQMSRLPPFNLPPPMRQKLVDFESAMTNYDGAAPSDGARAISGFLKVGDLGSATGFRRIFAAVLDLWAIREHVVLGVANKESGAISEATW